MQQQSQKRPLPPTPSTSTKYTTVNDAIYSLLSDTSYDTLTERERKWYGELSNCHKSLEQKDLTINNLKTIVMEWKRKAIEYENAYKELKRISEEREQFLIKQHTAEIEALSKAQIGQINDNLEVILQLERENERLRSLCDDNNEPLLNAEECFKPTSELQKQQQQLPTIVNGISNTSQLCHEAEIANRIAKESVDHSSHQDNELLQRINDMVNEMEDTLLDLQHSDYRAESPSANIPALVSDTYSSSSSEGEEDEEDEEDDEELSQEVYQQPQQLQPQQPAVEPKKRSNKSATIPSFLFRHKKFEPEDMLHQRRKMQSLSEPSNQSQQRKPLNTSLFLK